MTYCLTIALTNDLVFCSDSRTNAGIDQTSVYSKMHTFGIDGERQFTLLTAGNLATTQAVVGQIKRDMKEGAATNLMTVDDMDDAADYVGHISVEKQRHHKSDSGEFAASFIIGGQIGDQSPKVLMIYPQGNHITTSGDTAFLQIGESKYGKPILDRIITPETATETAVMCALVSMDSTVRSNLTVGPPIEVLIYRRDSLKFDKRLRFNEDSDYLRKLKRAWDEGLKEAFRKLPPVAWAGSWDQAGNARNEVSQSPDHPK